MKEFKGTKGMWQYKYFDNTRLTHSCVIYSQNGDNVCKMVRNDSDSKDTEIANAKLISAAPDLLEALQNLSDWYHNHIKKEGVYAPLYVEADQAIRKALGKD